LLLGTRRQDTTPVVGIADLTIVESGFTFGRSLLTDARIRWLYDLDGLITRLREVRASMRFDDTSKLPQRAVLLGFPADISSSVRQDLVGLSGAYGVALRCLPEPGSDIYGHRAELSRKPPDALYVWRPCAGKTYVLENAVRKARPSAAVTDLEEARPEDMAIELSWALAEQLDLDVDLGFRSAPPVATEIGWDELRARLGRPTFSRLPGA
jgi:hypothetical protein